MTCYSLNDFVVLLFIYIILKLLNYSSNLDDELCSNSLNMNTLSVFDTTWLVCTIMVEFYTRVVRHHHLGVCYTYHVQFFTTSLVSVREPTLIPLMIQSEDGLTVRVSRYSFAVVN